MRVISNIDAGINYGSCNHSVLVSLGSNGSNAYFQHTAENAPQLQARGGTSSAELFGVVTNWDTFGEQNNSLSEYSADFDLLLDAESTNKGKKL